VGGEECKRGWIGGGETPSSGAGFHLTIGIEERTGNRYDKAWYYNEPAMPYTKQNTTSCGPLNIGSGC